MKASRRIADMSAMGRGLVVLPSVLIAHAFVTLPVRGQYVESFQSWSATSANTWQTKNLAAAPFNVPANAVLEVTLRNDNASADLWGGVRGGQSPPYPTAHLRRKMT